MLAFINFLAALKKRKLTVRDGWILLSLAEQGDQSNMDFVKRVRDSSQCVALNLHKLETVRKLIKALPKTGPDKRRQLYTLTKLGRDTIVALAKSDL